MRIISSYHDYYDGIQAMGQDASVVYAREARGATHYLSPDLLPWAVADRWGRPQGPLAAYFVDRTVRRTLVWHGLHEPDVGEVRFDEAFVLLGGQAHAVWVRYNSGAQWRAGALPTHGVIGDTTEARILERLNQVERGRGRAAVWEAAELQNLLGDGSSKRWRHDEEEARYRHARQRFLDTDHTALHLTYGAPLLLVASPATLDAPRHEERPSLKEGWQDNCAVVVNPQLMSLHFQRVVEPYSAFQSLAQFVGGVLPGAQNPMVQLSDEDLLHKHAFDETYGFRKRPSEPKR